MEIPDSYIIHDTRIAKDFKGITISGYKRKDVINAFQNSIINNKLEDAIRWSVELHSTGLNNILWESLQSIYFRYIHINNPKFLIYLLRREKDYNAIISKYPKKHEIFSRNNQEIRNLYAELTSIATLTKKNNIFIQKSLPTINNKSFEKEDIHKRMISKNLDRITDFIFNTTTNEMKLALNEILSNLYSKYGTYQNCIYWYLWIEKIENAKKNENSIVFEKINSKTDKYFDHYIFIIWNILMNFENKLEKNSVVYLNKIHSLYKKNFKLTCISKRKYLIFIGFYIIKTNINWNINLICHEHLLIQSNANINKMYQNIIHNIEYNLSDKSKDILYKKYNQLFYKDVPETLKKVRSTNLTDDINKVLYTNYPEYMDLTKQNAENDDDKPDLTKLISKNMTIVDVMDNIKEKKNKKIDALAQFVSYKIKTNGSKSSDISKVKNDEESKDDSKDNNDNDDNDDKIEINTPFQKKKSVIDYYEEINVEVPKFKEITFRSKIK